MKKSDVNKVISEGRLLDLDLDIAIKVMGLGHLKLRKVPRYSSDLGEAVKVLEVLRKKGHRWLIVISEAGYTLRNLALVVHDGERDEMRYTADRPLSGSPIPETAAMLAKAICVAALEETSREISRKD